MLVLGAGGSDGWEKSHCLYLYRQNNWSQSWSWCFSISGLIDGDGRGISKMSTNRDTSSCNSEKNNLERYGQ